MSGVRIEDWVFTRLGQHLAFGWTVSGVCVKLWAICYRDGQGNRFSGDLLSTPPDDAVKTVCAKISWKEQWPMWKCTLSWPTNDVCVTHSLVPIHPSIHSSIHGCWVGLCQSTRKWEWTHLKEGCVTIVEIYNQMLSYWTSFVTHYQKLLMS